ncbi:MAG: 50S ribosomal protein L23 [Patescibacteria group bacterium]
MGIFDRKKKSNIPVIDEKKAPVKAKVTEVKDSVISASKGVGGNSALLLLSPRVSEKAALLASKGTYVFNVPTSANKVEVRKAVEALYSVHVTAVRTARGQGKIVSRARIGGRRNNWKKALVTLKAGEKLDLYEGV